MESHTVKNYLNPKYDEMFLNVARETDTIEEFMYALFEFLFKRTMFVTTSNNQKESIYLLNNYFKNWWNLSMNEKNKFYEDLPLVDLTDQIVDHIEEVTLEDDDKLVDKHVVYNSNINQNLSHNLSTYSKIHEDSGEKTTYCKKKFDVSINNDQDNININTEQMKNKDSNITIIEENSLKNDFQTPYEKIVNKNSCKNCIDTTNGVDLGHYWWSQTFSDICLNIDLSGLVKNSKDIFVKVTSMNLEIKIFKNNVWKTLIHDNFFKTIKDHLWTLTPEKHLQLNLEKSKAEFWSKCLCNDSYTVNKKNVEHHIPFHELPEGEKSKISEIICKQEDIESQNNENLEKLKKAWNLPGSPFAGTPFDPDIVQFP
ncbi:nudC domain-containing protein 3-like [Daktulosphaira vitifoliae]|uniref:nudC domain-containing protein 3-like n=1 Tax=Daktulosphaira vitifoliae TaxID=58002 RepID=UPI0021AA1266|nr:nudC domain-containing protein 3-like [Daktulosphaira vitifoliae]